MDADELIPRRCEVAADVALELPELALWSVEVDGGTARSTPEARRRLSHLSDRFRGAQAVALRRDPVPSAYRVLFRHVGLDPDAQRTPGEEAVITRLMAGGFTASDMLSDAILVALVETGVPLWALDAATLRGELHLRLAQRGERVGRDESAPRVADGTMVVADDAGPLAQLFQPVAAAHAVTRASAATRLFAVQAPGVPFVFVEEAFDVCVGLLET